jgi:DNA damage-binding protein 1
VLGYDDRTGEIITRANGDLQDRIGRLSDAGQLASIDPQNRMIAIQLYDGLLKIIPLEKSLLKEAFNLR